MKKAFFLFGIVASLALTACTSPSVPRTPTPTAPPISIPTVSPVASPTPASNCPEATAGTQLLRNEDMGYCLLYPDGYIRVDPLPDEVCLIPGEPFMACHSANLMIEVEAAAGRTASRIADEIVGDAEVAIPGIEIHRINLTVSDERAVGLEGLPGVASSRVIVIVHADRLYRLTFVLWDETGAEFAQLENLYNTVIDSFELLP